MKKMGKGIPATGRVVPCEISGSHGSNYED
jgi:hypothetical protein